MSVYDFVKEPSLLNFGMLAWDVVSLLPGVPGSYIAKGFKYADRIDDAIDTAKAIGRLDDVADALKTADKIHDGLKTIDNMADAAKTAEHLKDLSKASKGGRELLQEVAHRLIKTGDNLISDGRVIATSAKKAKQQAKFAFSKVQSKLSVVKGKVSSVTKKVSSSVKTKLDKVKALGGTKLDSLKTNVSSRISKAKNGEGIVCKAKSFVTNKPSYFTFDTLIDTEYGLRKIGELKVGDKVYSVDGEEIKIENPNL